MSLFLCWTLTVIPDWCAWGRAVRDTLHLSDSWLKRAVSSPLHVHVTSGPAALQVTHESCPYVPEVLWRGRNPGRTDTRWRNIRFTVRWEISSTSRTWAQWGALLVNNLTLNNDASFYPKDLNPNSKWFWHQKKSLNTKLLQKHQYLNKSRVSNKGHPLFIHYLSLII